MNEIAEFIICGKRGWYPNILCSVTDWLFLSILLHTMTWDRSEARHWGKLHRRADFTDTNNLIKLQSSLKNYLRQRKLESIWYSEIQVLLYVHENTSSMLSVAKYFPYICLDDLSSQTKETFMVSRSNFRDIKFRSTANGLIIFKIYLTMIHICRTISWFHCHPHHYSVSVSKVFKRCPWLYPIAEVSVRRTHWRINCGWITL